MAPLNRHPLLHRLHLLRAQTQPTHQTRLGLPLSHDDDDVALVNLVVFLRQPSAGASQAGHHQGRARENEPDGSPVDLDGPEGAGEPMDQLQRGDQRVVHVLPEERVRVQNVERHSVRKLDGLDLAFLRQQLIHVRAELRVQR